MNLIVTTQTFNVPCRRFTANLTVSKNERLPLVKEFVLRLIHIHRECDVDQLNAFFSFTERELAIVVKDLVDTGLVEFAGSYLSLTDETARKFETSEDGLPRISTVETWLEKFAIDFLSFSLIGWQMRPDGFRVFHDLGSSDVEKVSRSREIATEVLASSFYEYVEKFKPTINEEERSNLSIYGISTVEPRDTFTFPLKVEFAIDLADPSRAIHSYPDFQSEADQAKREIIVRSVARKLKELVGDAQLRASIYKVFVKELSDPFFKEFFNNQEFRFDDFLRRYVAGPTEYDEGASRVLVGGFAKEENQDCLLELLEEAMECEFDSDAINAVYFSKPTNDLWMRDSQSVSFVSDVSQKVGNLRKERPELQLVLNSRFERPEQLDRRLRLGNNRRIFTKAFSSNFSDEMAASEVVLIPGLVGAVNVLYWESGYDLPISVGFVTRDADRMKSLSAWAFKEWAGFGRKVTETWCSKRNSKRVEPVETDGREAFKVLTKSARTRPTITLQK
jgi:hypothetical protein